MRIRFVGAVLVTLSSAVLVRPVMAQETQQPTTEQTKPAPAPAPAEAPRQERRELPPALLERALPGQIVIPGGEGNFDPTQPIKPGFQISVNVTSQQGQEDALSGIFAVTPGGSIQFKQLIGLVDVKGLTPDQAAVLIAAKLKPYIKNAEVKVAIVSVPNPVVFLSGATTKPGATPINETTSLAELITIIPFSDNADLTRVRVSSKDEKGGRTMKEYNFLRWLHPVPGQKPDETQNPVLSDRDFVFVPLKVLPSLGIATVEGDVQRPGFVQLRSTVPTTIREVLSETGGPLASADRRQVTIRRFGQDRPYVLDYDKLEAGDPVNNIVVQPDDVVYVQKLAVDQFINLNGALIRPGRVPYNRDITLTQAIGDAGGLALAAKEQDGRIYRHVNGADPTKTQIIAFNFKKIRRNEQPDLMLEPGDTIEVPQGFPPKPAMEPLQLAQSLLSIALLVDRISGGR